MPFDIFCDSSGGKERSKTTIYVNLVIAESSMYLIYFDEAKNDPTTQNHYWIGGIAVHPNAVKSIEEKVNAISNKHFGSPCLGYNTEFHASHIFHRKGIFKSWSDPTHRISLIGSLLSILNDDAIKKLYVKIDHEHFCKKFSAKTIDELAFMFFCEKANQLSLHLQDTSMLIGDRENDSIASRYAERLSNWRNYKTDYSFGENITNLIDTVHFTQSHLSRLLQLVDIYTWCNQFISTRTPEKSGIPALMFAEILKHRDALFASKYKEYPLGC